MGGRRMDHRQVEVTCDERDRRIGGDVVEDDGAVEAEAGVALSEPKQRSGDEEQERERGGQGGIQLLPDIESTLRRVLAEEPAPIVGVEDVELTRRGAQSPAVAEDDDRRQGEDPRESREEVDVLHEGPPADLRRERRKVEHEPGSEEHEERRGVHPVQGSLRSREAPDVTGPAHAPFDRPIHASVSYPRSSQYPTTGSRVTTMRVTHLTLLYPYIAGTTSRRGAPCGRSRVRPTIILASMTSG